jgi:hypothetical protein
MNPSKPARRLLLALLECSQNNDLIDIFTLSQRSRLSLYELLRTLTEVERAGWADARRLRLTWPGLAIACALNQRRVRRDSQPVPRYAPASPQRAA